jgi:hypothetical protein
MGTSDFRMEQVLDPELASGSVAPVHHRRDADATVQLFHNETLFKGVSVVETTRARHCRMAL